MITCFSSKSFEHSFDTYATKSLKDRLKVVKEGAKTKRPFEKVQLTVKPTTNTDPILGIFITNPRCRQVEPRKSPIPLASVFQSTESSKN